MQGLVAVIVTVHQVAVLLGVLSAFALGLLSFAFFRAGSRGRRVALAAIFGLGTGIITFVVSAHLLQVTPLDVEIVSVD